MSSQLTIGTVSRERLKELRSELETARLELQAAEAALSAEQAAVNRFRMHCRLKIGNWVDDVLRQRADRQHLLTKLQLMRQSAEFSTPFDESDPYWEAQEEAFPSGDQPERETVLLPSDVPNDKAAEKRLYRELARRFHPDLAAAGIERAYATTMMTAVNAAYQNRDVVTLRNLAGELSPEEAAKVEQGGDPQERKLRKLLLSCRRRLRKVNGQFKAMRQENTARLWRKAQVLDAKQMNWWDAVRVELEAESARLAEQIDHLSQLVAKHSKEDEQAA